MRVLILIFGSKRGLKDDFGQPDTKKKHCFMLLLAKHFLEIALLWKQLRFQMIKNI